MSNPEESKKYNKWIIALSIVIPLVVGALFRVKLDIELPIFLPPVYASINAFTALFLVLAFLAIRSKKEHLHKRLMQVAIMLSVTFLVMYIAYHMTSDSTVFGDLDGNGVLDLNEKSKVGALRYMYIVILLTHILLSIAVIPFVLITYVRAITNDIERHKKIAKISFPLWLYVAISGVIVYIMISPYYA